MWLAMPRQSEPARRSGHSIFEIELRIRPARDLHYARRRERRE
jgi:hypothetical protein